MARIFLWRYVTKARNFPGYHLAADAAGCEQLLTATDEVQGTYPHRTLALAKLTDAVLEVANNRRAEARSWGKLRLSMGGTGLQFDEVDDQILVAFSEEAATGFRNAVRSMASGEGDFSYQNGPDPIWFWWC